MDLLPITVALSLPLLIGHMAPSLAGWFWSWALVVACGLGPIATGLSMPAQPPGSNPLRGAAAQWVARPKRVAIRPGPDGRWAEFPWFTSAMIVAGIMLFGVAPGEMFIGGFYAPPGAFDLRHMIWATLGGVFYHPDAAHLSGNILLWWIFGATLERRLGPGRYLSLVLLSGVLSSLISLNILISGGNLFDAYFKLLGHRPIGASGVIAGLMGFFTFSMGAAGFPAPPIRWRGWLARRGWVGTSVLIGVFLVRDLGELVWAAYYGGHLAGFAGGLMLARVFRLLDDDGTGDQVSAIHCR
jgi:membrane associated rhomboid family serine protease